MSLKFSRKEIKAAAKHFGFFACGVAKAERVDAETAARVCAWLEKGSQADMAYMGNYTDKRLDPRLLVPGTKTILSLAMNYAPAKTLPKGEYQLAAYAYGLDYHDIMKAKLRDLVEAKLRVKEEPNSRGESDSSDPSDLSDQSDQSELSDQSDQSDSSPKQSPQISPSEIRVFVDTAPVLERYWAWKAGLGWIGKSHQLIIPHAGSMFFLGEIFLPYEFDEYDEPMPSRCGNCRRCIDACPTHAITEAQGFDSVKCLSYQLIENRGTLSEEAVSAMHDTIYGCDRCQTACPWNKFATPNTTPEFQPKPELMAMTKDDWHNLTLEQYRKLFKGSAVKRVKFEGLKRNIAAANGNSDVIE